MKKGKTGVSDTSSDTKVRRGLWSRLFRKECKETAAISQQSDKASLLSSGDMGAESEDDALESRKATEPSSLADEIMVSSGITSETGAGTDTSCATNDSDKEYQQRVASLAKAIWKAEGCPEGMAEEHWFRAERELRGK